MYVDLEMQENGKLYNSKTESTTCFIKEKKEE